MKLFSLFAGLSLSLLAVNGDKSDLTIANNWQEPAAGTWKLELGETDAEMRYTDLAAEKPRLEALKKLGPAKFPFAKSAISTIKTADGKLVFVNPDTSHNAANGLKIS